MADKVKKSQYTVTVGTSAGYTAIFDDSEKAGEGAAAYAALTSQADIRTADKVIPFHAVDHAEITFTLTEVDKPEDETCQ